MSALNKFLNWLYGIPNDTKPAVQAPVVNKTPEKPAAKKQAKKASNKKPTKKSRIRV